MGGMIGFQLAVSRPELVRSLVIINSGPELVPRTLKMKLALALRLVILQVLGPRTFGKVLAPKLFPKPEQAKLRQQMQDTIAANEPGAYLRATRGLIGWSVQDRLPEIKCPVLVLAADRGLYAAVGEAGVRPAPAARPPASNHRLRSRVADGPARTDHRGGAGVSAGSRSVERSPVAGAIK